MKASLPEPAIKYVASSPHGDVIIDDSKKKMPLILTRSDAAGIPAKTDHSASPQLTYKDYLHLIKQFISRDSYRLLLEAVSNTAGKTVILKDIDEIVIRSEKHGSLYHVARVETVIKKNITGFAVIVTFSPQGKCCMNQELSVLQQLHDQFSLPFLPHLYFRGEEKYQAGKGGEASALMFLGEWFDGYHEFHLSVEPRDSRQKVIIWDFDHGYKYASDRQSREIYRHAAKILTLYYDIDTFKHIFPWHHAAGDFIVRVDPGDGHIDVKVITARGYDPVIALPMDGPANKHAALVHFLSTLSVRMRLDRLDGVGDIAWAGDMCVDGVVEGFFDALKTKEETGEYSLGKVEEFSRIVRCLTRDDWEDVLAESLDIYSESDPELPVILHHLKHHAHKLYSAVQAVASP